MKHSLTLLRTLALTVLSSAVLLGCDDDEVDEVFTPDGDIVFADVDDDGDGSISEDEYTEFYDQWDLDDDGVIDEEEWSLEAEFDAVDADGDGFVDQEEYDDAFAVLDANSDDFLDSTELVIE